jgi:hypothetical protein
VPRQSPRLRPRKLLRRRRCRRRHLLDGGLRRAEFLYAAFSGTSGSRRVPRYSVFCLDIYL